MTMPQYPRIGFALAGAFALWRVYYAGIYCGANGRRVGLKWVLLVWRFARFVGWWWITDSLEKAIRRMRS